MIDTYLAPITLNFSTLKGYTRHSLLEVAKNPRLPLFDTDIEHTFFETVANDVYLPLLNILEATQTPATIIITGHFLSLCDQYSPLLLAKLQTMVATQQCNIIANAYYGNSLTSLYHSHWWAQSIKLTTTKIIKLLHTQPHGIYIDQLFRGLELERVQDISTRFLLRHKETKYNYVTLSLSELRKTGGETVSWINQDNDCECVFFYVPNSLYFDINNIYFTPNRASSAKTLALKAGSVGARLNIRKATQWKPLEFKTKPRLSERYSLALYTPTERAVIRLWEYGAYTIASVYNNSPDTASGKLFRDFARLQDTQYLRFLKKQTYKNPDLLIFTSPFEAFVHMQTMIKQLEMNLHT